MNINVKVLLMFELQVPFGKGVVSDTQTTLPSSLNGGH